MTDIDAMVGRLRATFTVRDEFSTCTPLCNPDGPDAAAMLLALKAERDDAIKGRDYYAGLYANRCGQLGAAQSELADAADALDRLTATSGKLLAETRQALETDRDE